MTRTVQDWGSLVLAELDGREEPGTTARPIAEAAGKVAADADDVVASPLLKLAEKLGAPTTVQKQIKDLSSAATAAKTEQAALSRLRQDTEAALERTHATRRGMLAQERRDHAKELADGRAEVDAMRKEGRRRWRRPRPILILLRNSRQSLSGSYRRSKRDEARTGQELESARAILPSMEAGVRSCVPRPV
jgi:hypothetical protein